MNKRRITLKGMLNILGDMGEHFLDLDPKDVAYRTTHPKVQYWEDYFPSVVKQVANKLERRGLVEKIETRDGVVVKINEKGKRELLKFKLNELRPKKAKWDGKWRIVFFDVAEIDRQKRNLLRKYLRQMGMELFQESLFICPYDLSSEVKYVREVLGIPHGVKLGILEWVENEEDLKEIFDLK